MAVSTALKVRLLRTTRKVSLTEAGVNYFATVSDILQNLAAANKQVKSFNQEVIGTLKIGLPASISHLYVSPKLHQFLAKFPRMKIHIVHGNHLLDLLDNGFDLILHCGQLPDSSFYYKKLGVWKKICCAAPPYIKRYGMPQQPSELVNYNCLIKSIIFIIVGIFKKKIN